MKYIFTLSGNSERFTKDGFITKSLIKINNKAVIEYVLDMFPNVPTKDMVFIVNFHDIEKYEIDKFLKTLYNGSQVIGIPNHTKGPVASILNVEGVIENDEPYVIAYCDLTHKWNFPDFLSHVFNEDCDGCLVTHSGKHPHRMRNINFAHLKVKNSIVEEVREKGYFTDDPIGEFASSGIYYFKSGQILKQYFKKLIENKETVNGEFYVTLVYNQMIRDGLKVTHYPTDNYVCLGTPNDLISFKYWRSVIDNKLSKDEVDFVKNYWIDYHDNS